MSDNTLPTPCPSCGSVVEFEAVTTLLPNSETLRDLYSGELNVCVCATCDQPFRIATPILFRDDATRTLVYLLPDDEVDEKIIDALVGRIVKETFGETDDVTPPTVRVVTEHPHLLEKIAVLQKGLDDRVVEYVKYLLFQNSNEIDAADVELLFDFTTDSSADTLTFIAFDRETRKGTYGLEFDKADYDELVTIFTESPDAGNKLNELFPGHVVSVQGLLQYAAQNE